MFRKFIIIFCGILLLQGQLCVYAQNKGINVARSVYGTKAQIEEKGKTISASPAVDGRLDDNSAIKFSGVPANLILTFASQYQVSRVRIYPGVLLYANYPSGECGIRSYRIEGLINGGWKLLAKRDNAPDYKSSGSSGGAQYFFEHRFTPIKVEALRLVVLESGFTGKTSASNGKVVVAPKDRQSFIREIQVFQEGGKIKSIDSLSDKLETDFRLPVYRDQTTSKLVIVSKHDRAFDLNVSIADEKEPGKTIITRNIKVNPGTNQCEFDISKLADGRYLTTLQAAAGKTRLIGKLVRLLRIDRLPEAVLPPEPVNVSKHKVFPFDNYYVAKRSGVKNKLVQAEIHQASGMLAPNRIRQRAWNMNFDEKGSLVIKFFDETRSGKDRKWHYAWSKDLKNWQVGDKPPAGKEVRNPPGPHFPAEVLPDWRITAKDNEDVFRFYDPERDGKPELNQILVKYSSVKKIKWGRMNIPYRSTYAVWQNKNGEVLLLDKEPLLIDKVSFEPDEFEKENYTNDNFAPQYLGNKGKTLYYPRGAMVRRFKPFTAEYDNLSQGARLLKIFYTRDGFNWKHKFFTLPTEKDSWGYQHYGANIMRIPNANLFIAYLYAYDVEKQQIYLEINYSRDGLRWQRMPDQPPFVGNGKFGDWNSGMVFLDGRYIERNGVYYHVMGHVTSICHFCMPCYRDDLSGMSPQALERRFKSRELEKWPYFKSIGGWNGLSEYMLKAYSSTGVLSLRKDSWIGVEAQNKGELISRVLEAEECKLFVNAAVRDGGKVKVEVLSPDNKELPDYSGNNAAILTSDRTAAELSWKQGALKQLPSVPFRLRISLEKATLYTLDFVNNKRLVVKEDFDNKKIFRAQMLESVKTGNPQISWRKFQTGTVEIVPEGKDGGQAVLLTRVDRQEGLAMRGFRVGKNKDYTLTFSLKRYPEGTFGVTFDSFSPRLNVFSIYVAKNGDVYAKSGKAKPAYYPTMMNTKPGQWYKVRVDFDHAEKSYSITVSDHEGNEQKSKRKIILPEVEKIDAVTFRPAPGAGNRTLIDSIELREK